MLNEALRQAQDRLRGVKNLSKEKKKRLFVAKPPEYRERNVASYDEQKTLNHYRPRHKLCDLYFQAYNTHSDTSKVAVGTDTRRR